jgi:hypothetical protein
LSRIDQGIDADQGVADILGMEFIAKDAGGTAKKVDVWEFAVPEGVDLSACCQRAC